MGKSRPRTTTTSQKTTLPAWVSDAGKNTFDQAKTDFSRPFRAFRGKLSSDLWRPGAEQAYLNPYTKSVTQEAVGEVQRASDIMGNQIGARAQAGGAFGGSRHAIAESEHRRNTLDKVRQTSLQGYDRGFTTARGNAFRGAGMEQADLDRIYGEFLREDDDGRSNSERLMALLSGTPVNRTTTGTQTKPGPDRTGQIIGAVSNIAAAAVKSDERLKENRKPADGEKILTAFRDMPVESHDYTDQTQTAFGAPETRTGPVGQGNQGSNGENVLAAFREMGIDNYDYKRQAQTAFNLPESRTGPMAQDYQGAFGGEGSDGTMIDMGDALGKVMAAIKALDARTRGGATETGRKVHG